MMNPSFIIKRSYTQALAVFLAVIFSYYFGHAEKFWLVITAILVMQTKIGITLRQGVQHYIVIVLSIIVGTFLILGVKQPQIIACLIICIFSLCCYYAVKQSGDYFFLTAYFLFGMVILIAMLLPAVNFVVISNRVYDVTLGAIIGILTNLLIFPSRVDDAFRRNIVPVLYSYSAYLTSIVNLLYKNEDSGKVVNTKRIIVEDTLQTQSPFWVYQSGLGFSFQPGHRHFLIMIERIGQILFSMQHVARHEFDKEFLNKLQEPLNNYVEQVKKIFQALITILYLKKIHEGVSDLSEELVELEKKFQTIAPTSLELIELSKDYILFAAFVVDLKDIRTTLLKLIQALR